MASNGLFHSRKDRADQALSAARYLFPSPSATSPPDNSVQALLERLRLSEQAESSDSEPSAERDVEDVGQGGTRAKQNLLRQGAERGLDFLERIQDWLVLEEQKTELGLTSTDCKLETISFTNISLITSILEPCSLTVLLSIQQRALVQRITQHVVGFLLLPTLKDLCEYIAQGKPMQFNAAEFQAFVGPFLRILRLSTPPTGPSGSVTTSPADLSSNTAPQHITYVTQTFRNATTLVHLMASAILVGWYEAVARDPTSPLYRMSRGFLDTLGGRTETISVLGGVVRLTAPTSAKVGISDPRTQAMASSNEKVNVHWPPYVMAVARAMMARQITLPRGVMGLMTCVFGTGLGKNEGECPFDLVHNSLS